MIRISFSISLSTLLFVTGINASALAPTPATPDTISIVVEKAEISSDDLTFIPIFDNQTDPVDLTSSTSPIFGQKDQIPVGTYRVLHLTVKNISWHATWSLAHPSNPSTCDGATSGEATGVVDLGGHTDFYFKTPDLGGNTLAYYQANPPISPSAYVGDANHPFVLVSQVNVAKDKITTVNLTIGMDHTLTCDAVGIYDRLAFGNVAPSRILTGPSTQFNGLEGVYLDATNDEIGVINSGNNSVAVYRRTDTGNVSPLRTLMGPNTRLNDPEGIALYQDPADPTQDELIVANQGSNSLTVYSRSAAGNAKPLRTIVGMQTGLSHPAGIALYPDPAGNPAKDEMVVANQGNDSLTVYNRLFSKNSAPLRTIIGPDTGLNSPCGLYVDEDNDEIGVANNGNDSVTIYDRVADADAPPKRPISGLDTGLSHPCSIYVDTQNNEIGVANSGNGTVTIYNRTDTGNVAPKRTITGLNDPRALYLDSTRGEIGVVQQGPQVVMAFAPPIFPVSANETASNSVLSGDYNVVFYGVDIQGVNGHGTLVPVVFAERGKVTFDPIPSPWPSFSLALDTQIRRQVIEPDCPTEPDFNSIKNGFYGVNDNGSFYAFLPGILGSVQGAFLQDGSAFVGSMVDSSSRLLLVYGVRSTATITPYLTSDGTFGGMAAQYFFNSYRPDFLSINRFNAPPKDDLFLYRLAIGGADTNKTEFIDVNSEVNFLEVFNPMGDFAAPKFVGPIFDGNADNVVSAQSYTSSQGGILNSSLNGLAGALGSDGATLIFMRNTVAVDDKGCPTDIGFGTGLRHPPPGTFGPESLKGTYFMAGFGDRYSQSSQTSSSLSEAATITFDGVGNAAIQFINNEMGIISVSQAEFTYKVGAANTVNIFDRLSMDSYASVKIGSQGQSLVFYQSLNPNGDPNPTRLLGLALFQHP